MKSEAELCTAIEKSMDIGFKIPDPTSMFSSTIKRCFDLFGSINSKPTYIEAKFNKTMSAFNLKRIEPHQAEWLTKFLEVDEAQCYVVLGVYVARGDTRAYVFDWKFLKKFYDEQYSIYAKELKSLPYNKIIKGTFKFENIIKDLKASS